MDRGKEHSPIVAPGLKDDQGCFACGLKNKGGLRLAFHLSDDGKKVLTTFTPPKRYQGWKNFLHGGIIVTLLDEVMAKAAHHRGHSVMTGAIEARFKSPARINETLHFEGEIEDLKRKILYTRATACKEDGTIVALAKAKMVIIE